MSVGLSSNSVQCQKKLQILRLVQTRGSHKVQGRVCPRIHTSGARQPDRPLKANSRCKATWSALCCLTCCAGREWALGQVPFFNVISFLSFFVSVLTPWRLLHIPQFSNSTSVSTFVEILLNLNLNQSLQCTIFQYTFLGQNPIKLCDFSSMSKI